MVRPTTKLSSRLPPLIFGTATFSYQFNPDPHALHPTELVERALKHGVRAFDTSPYYGPAETILGDALATSFVQETFRRDQYFILTKVGRVSKNSFDYSPQWIQHSVNRSCDRFRTSYLDVVYCHDAEFVTPAEVLTAIRELRRIRDEEGRVKYVGICGYPVYVLCELAEMILNETGEPLDIIQSYSNFTLQNTRLLSVGLDRFIKAGVDVVANASPLSMGLIRRNGPPVGALGDWHPAPDGLRKACLATSHWVDEQGDKIEKVGFRYAVETWMEAAATVGTHNGDPHSRRIGVSVMGVSTFAELEETMSVWQSVVEASQDGLARTQTTALRTSDAATTDREWNLARKTQVQEFAIEIRRQLGEWRDFAWESPQKEFVNQPHNEITARETKTTQLIRSTNVQGIMTPPPSDPDNA